MSVTTTLPTVPHPGSLEPLGTALPQLPAGVQLDVVGDLAAAERALYILAAGPKLGVGTNGDAIEEQAAGLHESMWARLHLLFAHYPYMVDRVVELRRWGQKLPIVAQGRSVGVLPVHHVPMRPLPILLIHGHDQLALLQLKDYLRERFPHVVPRVMASAVEGALSMPEKFERLALDVQGAIAVMTPDDIGGVVTSASVDLRPRPSQNVAIEIGWIWGRLGRNRCLVLSRGELDVPSDLSGIELFAFRESPEECSERVRQFVDTLHWRQS